jgi:hypothetical protein
MYIRIMAIIMRESKKEMIDQKKEANDLNQLQQQEEKTKSEIQQNPTDSLNTTASETVMISELAVDNEYLDKFKILLADRYQEYLADVATGKHVI